MGLSRYAMAVALVAALFGAGCATEHYEMDAKHPAAVMSSDGMLEFRGKIYNAEKFAHALKKAGIPRDRMINIRVPDTVSDPAMLRRTRAIIGSAGYRRVIFSSALRAKSMQADGVDPMKDPRIYHAPGEKVYGAGW